MMCLHEEAGGQGEPLVVGDRFVVRVPHSEGYEHIEGNSDEDRGDKAEEEEEDEEVLDEMLLHKTLLLQTFTGCEYELKKVPASKLITVELRLSCWLTHSYNNSIKTSTSWDLCTPCHMIVSCCICVLCCVSCFLLH